MNSKPLKKQSKVQSKPKAKPKPKTKQLKPKISKNKVQSTKNKSLSNTQRLSDSSSVSYRYPASSLQSYSERTSLHLNKSKPQSLQQFKGFLNCQIRMKELVTQQDLLNLSDQDYSEQSFEFSVNHSSQFYEMSKDKAAIKIQKLWRGFLTRKLIKQHFDQGKKIKVIPKDDFQKTHKLLHHRKKSSLDPINASIELTQTKNLADIRFSEIIITGSDYQSPSVPQEKQVKTQIIKNTNKKVQQQLDKLRKQQTRKWEEIIKLIQYIPTQDINNNQLLKTLINRSQQNKIQLEMGKHLLPVDPSPSKSPSPSSFYQDVDVPCGTMTIINQTKFTEPLSDRTQSSGFNQHPFMKIIGIQSKMMKDRLDVELKRLNKSHDSLNLSSQVYEIKKQILYKNYEEQYKNISKTKSQINFTLQKAHHALISSKRDANFLYRTTGRETSLRHSLSDQSVLLNSFIKQRLFIEDQLSSCPSQESIKIKRTSTQLQMDQSPQLIIEQLQLNLKTEKQQQQNSSSQSQGMQAVKETVQTIQKNLQKQIIEQLCRQIFLNDKMYNAFLPNFQIQNFYKFRKLNDGDIESFLKVMTNPPFLPSKQNLLKRLNQKINPTALELLKILRNQQPEEQDQDDDFYQLVISEDTFKQFREWKQSSIATDLYLPRPVKNQIQVTWSKEQKPKAQMRQQLARQRKKKVLKFQKDLQAMYYKAVFNCFNQSIIEVKCSYSPLNGRSTIGPGELKVSLLDSNSPVSLNEIDSIVQKGKQKVLQNFKNRIPSLDCNSYSSLNKFQDALMKQVQHEFNLTEHKWISFFDQYLQIATEVTTTVIQQLHMEAAKEIYKMQLCRI